MTTGTELTVAQRASVALGASEHEKKLRELAKQSTEIVAITNAAGYQQLHAARMVLKTERIALEKLGKGARDDATKFSKAVIEEEKRLIGIIAPEEQRLQAIQDEHDQRVEREKQVKIEAERVRVLNIRSRIDADLRMPATALTILSGSVVLATTLEDVKAIAIDESFAEFAQEAEQVKVQTVVALNKLHAEALAYEAEQRQLRADREEAARLRAAEEKRTREAAEKEAAEARRRADEQAAAQARIEQAERESRLKIEAQERAARERLAEEERVAKIAREAEERRQADERRAIEEQQRKLREEQEAAERAERQRQEEIRLKAEAEEREIQRQQDELLGGRALLTTFVTRYGKQKVFAPIAAAINTFLSEPVAKAKKAA